TAIRWFVPPARTEELTGPRRLNRRTQYDDSGLLHASAVGGWRSLRPSGPSLESEDVGIHLRHPQQYPHHRSRPIRADDAPRLAGGERYGCQRRGAPFFSAPPPPHSTTPPPPP